MQAAGNKSLDDCSSGFSTILKLVKNISRTDVPVCLDKCFLDVVSFSGSVQVLIRSSFLLPVSGTH